jgi:hypothetical protein
VQKMHCKDITSSSVHGRVLQYTAGQLYCTVLPFLHAVLAVHVQYTIAVRTCADACHEWWAVLPYCKQVLGCDCGVDGHQLTRKHLHILGGGRHNQPVHLGSSYFGSSGCSSTECSSTECSSTECSSTECSSAGYRR